jgi:hypothetical protein
VFIPSPPQTIIEERLVPVSPPPVYVYPNPYPPNCSRGRYWDGDSCRKIDCPSGFHWDNGICKPRDCDRDEYFDGSRCRKRPRTYNPPSPFPRPTRDWDREGRDRDYDDERNTRSWKLGDLLGRDDDDDNDNNRPTTSRGRGGGRSSSSRPTTSITTLLTPAPKADDLLEEEDEEDDDDNNGRRPRTSPVAALAAFTGKRYEYI